MHLERITGQVANHAEGPVWSEAWRGLKFVDMLAGDVLSLNDDGTVARMPAGSPIAAAIRPRVDGGMVIGTERGFALQQPDGEIIHLPPVWQHDNARMNEGACDPHGNFYCGSMNYDRAEGAARLYRLDTDHQVTDALDGLTISNGLAWTGDGRTVYHNDTPTFTVKAYDDKPEQGLTNPRVIVDLRDEELRPDGLTLDAEGGIWIALSNGSAVRRYTRDGKLDAVIELPAQKVTACTFGGDALDQMFITTSLENLQPEDDPYGGSLFMAEVGVAGLPVLPYSG